MRYVKIIIVYLPAWYLASLCTCTLIFTATQVANLGSGTSNHTGIWVTRMFTRGANLRRTFDIPRQLRPNQDRHSRMTSYHCFSEDNTNQNRCSSRAVVLRGSNCVDIKFRDLRFDTVDATCFPPCRSTVAYSRPQWCLKHLRSRF